MEYDSEMGFDRDAYNTTIKALCIIFILLILFSNALLIYKNVRKLDFYTRPKNQIIISMAIGDIFLALFSLVVEAKTMFEDNFTALKPCSLEMTSVRYSGYLIHFVYGLGICVLGIELMFRNKIHNMTDSKTSKIAVSLALSSFPWLLGIIVVLPLGLANWDPTTCEFAQPPDQRKAATVISVILPACAAVIVCIVINCCVFTSTRYQQQTVTSQPMAVLSTKTSSSPMQSGNVFTPPPSYEHYLAQQYPQKTITGQCPLQPYPQQMNKSQASQPYPTQQPYASAQPLIAAQPYTEAQQSQDVDLQSSTGNNLSIVQREKSRLLAIAIIFFLLVVPLAIFDISYTLNWNRTELTMITALAIRTSLFWMVVIRSFVTPLIMYCYSDDL